MLRESFDDNFSGYPSITDSVRHAGELSVRNIQISHYAQGPLQTRGNV